MRHIARWSCVKCYRYMTWGCMMDSYGICPNCGYNSNATVCDTNVDVGHWKYDGLKLKWGFIPLPTYRWISI